MHALVASEISIYENLSPYTIAYLPSPKALIFVGQVDLSLKVYPKKYDTQSIHLTSSLTIVAHDIFMYPTYPPMSHIFINFYKNDCYIAIYCEYLWWPRV